MRWSIVSNGLFFEHVIVDGFFFIVYMYVIIAWIIHDGIDGWLFLA